MEAEIRSLGLIALNRSRDGERVTLAVPVGHERDITLFLRQSDWAKWVIQDFSAPGGFEFDPPPSEMPAPTVGTPHPHNLWFLENTGQTITDSNGLTLVGVPGADVDILRAWERCQGDPSILVAVLDSGIDYSHPEFQGRIYPFDITRLCHSQNPPNCPFTSPNPGWCFTTPGIINASDNHGHGTAAASVLGASADNGLPTVVDGKQFAGVDPNCTFVSARVSFDNGYYFSEFLYALGEIRTDPLFADVKVINISFAGFPCPVINDEEDIYTAFDELGGIIYELYYRGVFIVTISGNNDILNDKCPNIWPHVVMVGATTNRDDRWSSSSFSPHLDFVAPGWGMYIAQWNHPCNTVVQYSNGTSAAGPVVAGIASLLYARAAKLGINLMPWMVYECLRQGAEPIVTPTPTITYQGHGRVNAYNALLKLEELYYDCDADLTHTNNPADFGYGVPDGIVDPDDLAYFTHWHSLGNVAIADIASTCTNCAQTSCNTPDGLVNANDSFAYLCRWNAGCP